MSHSDHSESPPLNEADYNALWKVIYEIGRIVAIFSVWGWQSFTMVSNTMQGTEKMICFVNHNGQLVSDIEALLWGEGVRLGEVSMEEVLGMEYGPVAIIALRNARSILGREWSLFHFNSEHFVTWATTGRAKYHQLVNVAANAQKAVVTGHSRELQGSEKLCKANQWCSCKINGRRDGQQCHKGCSYAFDEGDSRRGCQ